MSDRLLSRGIYKHLESSCVINRSLSRSLAITQIIF